MRFILFPEAANNNSGANIVVADDYRRLNIQNEDKVLWYLTHSPKENFFQRENDYVLLHPKRIGIERVGNVFAGKMSIEVGHPSLNPYIDELTASKEIHCDDYVFYRTIRHCLPSKELTVRFHNLHYRNLIRSKINKTPLDWKYKQVLNSCAALERDIFTDELVTPIFISSEDQLFYELMTKRGNSRLWGIDVEDAKVDNIRNKNRLAPIEKIVFYGGLSSHKVASVLFFSNTIWPLLRKEFPNLEFHLYGKGTETFNKQELGIWGHGFFSGDRYPHSNSSLYINPDLIGGGVKIKLKNLLNNGIPFISNAFGYEGYDTKYIDGKYTIVEELNSWVHVISTQIKLRK